MQELMRKELLSMCREDVGSGRKEGTPVAVGPSLVGVCIPSARQLLTLVTRYTLIYCLWT